MLLLPKIDADLAAKVRVVAGCPVCGGRLDVANYPRKPRGADVLGDDYDLRASFCCAVDGCRRRRTPVSVRFLGRKVYLGAVVVLASALARGPSKTSVTQLSALLGITRRTLARGCRWWSTGDRLVATALRTGSEQAWFRARGPDRAVPKAPRGGAGVRRVVHRRIVHRRAGRRARRARAARGRVRRTSITTVGQA